MIATRRRRAMVYRLLKGSTVATMPAAAEALVGAFRRVAGAVGG